MSLFTTVREELIGSPETSKNLSLSASKELSALMYSIFSRGMPCSVVQSSYKVLAAISFTKTKKITLFSAAVHQ